MEVKEYRLEVEIDAGKSLVVSPSFKELILVDEEGIRVRLIRIDR